MLSFCLIALLPIHFVHVHARTDIAAQLYDNSAFTAPTTPSKLNAQLTDLVNTVDKFTSLANNLQRALLWSAGWVQVATNSEESSSSSSNSTKAEYAQVYVLCGRSMSDVFQSAQAFDDEAQCELKNCKNYVISYTTSTCDSSYVATKAHCAVSSDVNVTPRQSTGPMWSFDGEIDADRFDPRLFQYNNSASEANTTLYMLAQMSSWTMNDDSCPNSVIFIAPCVQVDAESVAADTRSRFGASPTSSSVSDHGFKRERCRIQAAVAKTHTIVTSALMQHTAPASALQPSLGSSLLAS